MYWYFFFQYNASLMIKSINFLDFFPTFLLLILFLLFCPDKADVSRGRCGSFSMM